MNRYGDTMVNFFNQRYSYELKFLENRLPKLVKKIDKFNILFRDYMNEKNFLRKEQMVSDLTRIYSKLKSEMNRFSEMQIDLNITDHHNIPQTLIDAIYYSKCM